MNTPELVTENALSSIRIMQDGMFLWWPGKNSYSLAGKFWFIGYIHQTLMAQRVKRLPAMWETWVQSLGWEDPLEKEMVTHFSTHAWKIPWMEEPCRPQPMGLQRVGHDWAILFCFIHQTWQFQISVYFVLHKILLMEKISIPWNTIKETWYSSLLKKMKTFGKMELWSCLEDGRS